VLRSRSLGMTRARRATLPLPQDDRVVRMNTWDYGTYAIQSISTRNPTPGNPAA
jgi:hypothetical protein